MSLPSDLYRQIKSILIASGQFDTDSHVMHLFVDTRLTPWRNRLPTSNNLDARVASVITLLDNQFDSHGEPALLSLIMVLLDRVHPGDSHHKRLDDLREVLSHRLSLPTINIEQELKDLLPESDPRSQRLERLFRQLRLYNETLREWKQLHRHLDNLTNITYGQFATQIERFRGKPIDLPVLQDAWKPVYLMTNRMLEWAKTIKYIGEPYQVESNVKRGVEWAIKLSEITEAVHEHLSLAPAELEVTANRAKGIRRFIAPANVQSGDIEQWRSWWWPRLVDLSGQLEHDLRRYMTMTDEHLRQTASDLYDLSNAVLWSKPE